MNLTPHLHPSLAPLPPARGSYIHTAPRGGALAPGVGVVVRGTGRVEVRASLTVAGRAIYKGYSVGAGMTFASALAAACMWRHEAMAAHKGEAFLAQWPTWAHLYLRACQTLEAQEADHLAVPCRGGEVGRMAAALAA